MLNSVPPAKEGGGTKHPFQGILPIISHRGEDDNRGTGEGGGPAAEGRQKGRKQPKRRPARRAAAAERGEDEKRRGEREKGKKGKSGKGSKETKKKGGIAKKVL